MLEGGLRHSRVKWATSVLQKPQFEAFRSTLKTLLCQVKFPPLPPTPTLPTS